MHSFKIYLATTLFYSLFMAFLVICHVHISVSPPVSLFFKEEDSLDQQTTYHLHMLIKQTEITEMLLCNI